MKHNKKFFNKDRFNISNPTTFQSWVMIWQTITSKRKKQLIGLFFLMLLSGFSEILTLKLFLPVSQSLINFESFQYQFKFISYFKNLLQIDNIKDLQLILIFFFIVIIIFASITKLSTLWLNEKIAALIGNDITSKAFSVAIRQPYSIQINRNSSNIIATMIRYSDDYVNSVKMLLKFAYFSLLSISILIGLISINFNITFFAIVSLFIFYFLTTSISKKKTFVNGEKINKSVALQSQSIQESLGSIKNILIDRSFNIFEKSFEKADITKRQAIAENSFLGLYPKIVLEGIGLISISIFAFISTFAFARDSSFNLSLIGTFALGCQKLLPAIQSIYFSINKLISNISSIKAILKLVRYKGDYYKYQSKKLPNQEEFNLKLENCYFKYSGSRNWNIKSVNIEIKKGQKIGIIGETGSGKSTLVDLMLGLLKPEKGKILFNNIDISSNLNSLEIFNLHDITAYVPQNIYITDDDFYNNIALGINSDEIDFGRVKECSKQANLDTFICNSKNGYKTILGERGVKLSGGQIQRIGIARALYKNPKLLILDEATSALDTNTEQKILQNLDELNENITIIMIAHRLNTLKNCNSIIEIKDGSIKELMTNEQLKKRIYDESF